LAGCPKGGVTLDPFAGAATTGVVAKKNGRDFIGIEIKPEYKEMGDHRIEEILL
jgi:DNA modification methylase